MTKTKNPTLLVTGASGKLGRRVVELLVEAGAGPIVATTRTPEKLADLADKGVEVRKADFDEPASLPAAFKGADRVLLISGDSLETRLDQHRAAVEAAVAAGVKHVVYTSIVAPRPDPDSPVTDSHYWTEQALAESTLPGWTVLRNNIYAEMILMGLPQAVESGQLFAATKGRGRNYVTREDCAGVAAAALADDFDGKRVLDVSGPAPVTQDELAAIAGELSGRDVRHVDLPAADLRAGMIASGMPALYADAMITFDVDAANGHHAVATSVVKELTGQEPTAVKAFLAANRAALVPAEVAEPA